MENLRWRVLDRGRGIVSLPFEAGEHKRVAVKIVDDRGIESLRILEIPVSPEDTLRQSVERIVTFAQPVFVILLGSRARGDADDGSDFDFLVVEREVHNPAEESACLRRAVGSVEAGVNVVVVDEAAFDKWSEAPGSTLYWAKREGRVLYPRG